MFRFEHPDYLWALVLLPILALVYVWYEYRQRWTLRQLGERRLLLRLLPGWSLRRTRAKVGWLLLALLLLLLGWANPQWGYKLQRIANRSTDVYLALDLSQSMLAEDLAPNRLAQAQRFALQLVEQLKDNRLGLIIFAGNAYLQVPLTKDYNAIALMIKSAHPDQIPLQGTAIGEAIDLVGRPPKSGPKMGGRALIILSDGENHVAGAESLARKARNAGLRIFTVGLGTAEGSLVPFIVDGERDYKRDETGSPVVSRFDGAFLRRLAKVGGGSYHYLQENDDEVLRSLDNDLSKLERRQREQRVFREYQSHFQSLLLLGWLLLVLEWTLSYRRAQASTAQRLES